MDLPVVSDLEPMLAPLPTAWKRVLGAQKHSQALHGELTMLVALLPSTQSASNNQHPIAHGWQGRQARSRDGRMTGPAWMLRRDGRMTADDSTGTGMIKWCGGRIIVQQGSMVGFGGMA